LDFLKNLKQNPVGYIAEEHFWNYYHQKNATFSLQETLTRHLIPSVIYGATVIQTSQLVIQFFENTLDTF
jgi:hypothetical protein